jgi:hypothetical protein
MKFARIFETDEICESTLLLGIAFAASAYHYSPFPFPQVQNNLFYERAVSP